VNYRSLLLILSLPILGVGAFTFWLWTDLTAQPHRLSPVPPGIHTFDRHQQLAQAHDRVWMEISSALGRNRKAPVRISQSQLQAILTYDIAHANEDKRAGQVLQGIDVRFEADRLIIETQLDLSQITIDEMSGSERAALLRLFKHLPGLRDRSIVVAIEGRPQIQAPSTIGLADARIQVGRFRWTIAEASRYLQVPSSYIETLIHQELFLAPMEHFTQIGVEDNALLLKGKGTAW
jgi:hypothetical protein